MLCGITADLHASATRALPGPERCSMLRPGFQVEGSFHTVKDYDRRFLHQCTGKSVTTPGDVPAAVYLA
jgi:hypothetical protein